MNPTVFGTERVQETGDRRGNVFYMFQYQPSVRFEVSAHQATEICWELRRTAAGVGVFAILDITPQSLILVYSGEVISYTEAEKREAYRDFHFSVHQYRLEIGDLVIHATNLGNFALYINHS